MKRRRKPEPHLSHERWLVSYADFITLLFAFFTTMYAISTVDSQKLNQMVESMQAAFTKGSSPVGGAGGGSESGVGPARIPAPPRTWTPPASGQKDEASVEEVRARLAMELDQQIDQGLVQIEIDPRGLVVSIREAGSFATGRADLSAVAQALLVSVAAGLRDVGNFVRVEGHTDNVPIHTDRFRSNWELSTARATNVVAFFLDQGLEPGRLSAAGYAEYHPRVPNDADSNRARNRRIDVVVLNPQTSRREEPGAQASFTPSTSADTSSSVARGLP